MSKLTLDQFKTDNKSANDSRLTLDQFKKENSNNVENKELEKLAGGILGACHVEQSIWSEIGHGILKSFGLER